MTHPIVRSFITSLALASAALVIAPGCASTATRASTGQFIDDSVITTKVKAALVRDDATPGRSIGVDTFKGTVQLSGFVDDAAQKTQAGLLAAKVEGVKEVRNDVSIRVVPTTTTGVFIDDSVVTTKVKTALARNDATPATAIKVDTNHGTVQLSGFVDTEVQKTEAAAVAGRTEGVKEVINNIIVKLP